MSELDDFLSEDRQPEGALGWVFDILSRPQYASMKFYDTLAEDGIGAMGDALLGAGQELVTPKERLAFGDLIKKYRPDFADKHPTATNVLDFVGNVALDPSTYFSLPLGSSQKVGKFVLSKLGKAKFAEEFALAMDKTANAMRGLEETVARATTPEALEKASKDFYESIKSPVNDWFMKHEGLPRPPEQDFFLNVPKAKESKGFKIVPQEDPFLNVVTPEWESLGKPPVSGETVRLYQRRTLGTEPSEWMKGTDAQRFTTDIDKAQKYGDKVKAIDVPASEVYGTPEGEFFLTKAQRERLGISKLEPNFEITPKTPRAKKDLIGYEGEPRAAELMQEVQNLTRDWSIAGPVGATIPKARNVMAEMIEKLSGRIKDGTITTDEAKLLSDFALNPTAPKQDLFEELHKMWYPDAPKYPTDVKEFRKYWGKETADSFLKMREDISKAAKSKTPIDLLPDEAAQKQITEQLDKDWQEMFTDALTSKNKTLEGAKLPQEEAWSTAEKRMLDAIEASGGAGSKLVDKGGLKFMGKTIIPGSVFSKTASALGLSKVANVIESTKTFETLAKAFNRDYKLPEEYVQMRKFLEARLGMSAKRAEDMVSQFYKLNEDSRNKLGKLSHDINDATMLEDKLYEGKLTQARVDAIAQEWMEKANLTPAEQAFYARSRQIYDDIYKAEREAGLIDGSIKNYAYRNYEAVKDAPGFLFYKKIKDSGKLGTFLGSSEARVFENIAKAQEAGFKSEMDIAQLLALRAHNSEKKIAQKQFNDWTDLAFKDLKEASKNLARPGKGGEEIAKSKIWNRIIEDIDFIGHSNFPAGLGSAQNELVGFYDSMLRKFKALATVAKPAFGVKQGISNTIQQMLEPGMKVSKVFDPRTMRDAATALLYNNDVLSPDTPWAKKILEGTITSPMNDRYSIKEVLQLAEKYGVLKGTNLSGEALKDNLRKMLRENEFIYKKFGDKHEGLGKALVGAMKYWNLPGHMEDFGRLSMFMNGLRLGHGPRQAANMVEKALFDYGHGLSQFERQMMRRIVPFYSFQRFALPFTARVIAANPGRVQNMSDAAHALFNAWNKFESGDTLNPDERRALPNYLMEQPRVFAKMNEKMQAVFRTFNNFSPLEMLGMLETTPDGDIDTQRSLMKTVLAQMSPIFKMPLEFMVDKNFFTDQAISKAHNPKAGKLGKIDPDALIPGASQLFESIGGIPGIGGGAQQIGQFLKEALGWEQDPKTGTVYINPTIAHIATSSFPILNQLIRTANPERTPAEKFLDIMGGVGTQKVDLKQSYRIQRHQEEKQIREMQDRIRLALIYGRLDEAELSREQLKELLKLIAQERQSINFQNIRGGF